VTVYGQGDVTVLDKQGAVTERIATIGKLPTNVAFGLPGQKKIYVTEYERGVVEVFKVASDGLPLWT
jgi:gluconolactonase